jgi:hypothetical protein
MGQADKPRFSYITVGGAESDNKPQPEEEVITIGAVDVESSPAQVTGAQEPYGVQAGDAQTEDGPQAAVEPSPEQALDDTSFDIPLPTSQKVVFAACLVGLVVGIAFLVWYWLF